MEYTLKNSRFTAVADTKGAELFSLKNAEGTEFLWQGSEASWQGRSPNLFPIVSGLAGSYVYGGKEYEMPKHGFARTSQFEAVQKSDSEIALTLTQNEETLKVYPFNFSFTITYNLTETGFAARYTAKNTGSGTMPCFIGGHTGISCPVYSGENFEDYVIEFPKEMDLDAIFCEGPLPFDKAKTYPVLRGQKSLPLKYSYFDVDALVFADIDFSSVSVINPATQKGVKMNFEGFPALGIWTMGGKNSPYICIEPWHGMPALKGEGNTLESKAYCISLAPGEEKSLDYSLEIID